MTCLLEGKNLNKTFREKAKTTVALSEVNFCLNKGEVLGVVGESGSGKTTLLKAIAGMVKLDQGSLFYNGREYTGQKPRQTGQFLQMIFQDANSSFDPRMVMAKSLMESGRKEKDPERIRQLVQLVGLEEELLQRKPAALSGGQCQRMAIARAFYSDAQILLCDEMTSALDVSTQARVLELLQDLKKEGRLSAVFVSHDIALVSMLCDRIMVMKDGKCVEEGETSAVIRNPSDDYTRTLIESARRQSVQEPAECIR